MGNSQDDIKRLKEATSELQKTITIATVSTAKDGRARVIWENGIVSERLIVLNRGDGWMPKVGQKVLCVKRKDGGGFILGGI